MSKERSREGEGWLTRYKINRPLNDYEVNARLNPAISVDLPPIDKGILRLNSVFIEYMDRHFFSRGWAALGGIPMAAVCLWFMILFGTATNDSMANGEMRSSAQVMDLWIAVGALSGVLVLILYLLQKDFFRCTHYPIRFNRQNRKVYVFRHNGPDGVLELDWDQVYWFVGRSRDNYSLLYDLRCHVLDESGLVRETFAVGNCSGFQTEVLQHWEMIRRYMEEPLETLPFPPLALVLSAEPTLRNAVVIHIGGARGHPGIFMVICIFWTLSRWISQKTCRRPRWPAAVETVCQIALDDPFHLPEPPVSGTVAHFDEKKEQELLYYREQAQFAAKVYQAEKYGSGS